MLDEHYTDSRLTRLYDLDSPWGADTDFYIALAGASPINIADFGCGTGTLCCGLKAAGHYVTGIDPAQAMLDVAKKKALGHKVDWVLSDAETYRSDKKFNLVLMTGHAFQVLITDAQILQGLQTLYDHLEAGGRAAFESRNPVLDWNEKWSTRKVWDEVVQTRSDILKEGELVHFSHQFELGDVTLVSDSTLRFASFKQIHSSLLEVGFELETCFGDWNQAPFAPESSEEMIFIARKPAE